MTERDLWAIGDIHGCYDEMILILEEIEEKSPHGAEIVFLADYFDRGPKSREIAEFHMGPVRREQDEYIRLRGNHEDMFLQAMKPGAHISDVDFFMDNGGEATMNSFKALDYKATWPTLYKPPYWFEKENGQIDIPLLQSVVPVGVVDWVRSLPVYHRTENHLFVHAGAHPGIPIEEQPEYDLMWMRRWEDGDRFSIHGEVTKVDQTSDYEWHIVYGHTPRREPFLRPHCTGLDTGAVFGWGLTAASFDRYKKAGPVEVVTIPTPKYT